MATKPRYKTQSFQKLYAAILLLAADKTSEMYLPSGKPHRGAGHRCAFWDGYAGVKSANSVPGTMSSVAYQAGKVFAKTNPGIPIEDATWTPGFNRQGEKR